MKISICRNQFFNICKNCKYDVDRSHFPCNLDCPRYEPMGFVFIDLIDDKPKGGHSERDGSEK